MVSETKIDINTIELMNFTTEPTSFYETSFSSSNEFAEVMFACGKMFKDSEDIIVRYAKPIDKETNEVKVCFQILRSKSKIFKRHIVENDESFIFSVKSAKDVKSCIKYLNSLGVKADDGENLTESGYETIISNDVKEHGNMKIHVFKHDNYPLLEWSRVGDDEEVTDYKEIKEQIEKMFTRT